MLTKNQFKLNKKIRYENAVERITQQADQAEFSGTLVPTIRQVAIRKTGKKQNHKKNTDQVEEDTSLVDPAIQTSSAITPSGQTGVKADAHQPQYAQSDSITTDAVGSSTEPVELDKSNNAQTDLATTNGNESSLSTAQMVALGVIGAAVGGAAVAIAVSNNKTSSSQPDTTPPQIQSLNVNGNSITLVYSEALDPNRLPSASAFSVTSGGVFNPVTHVVANGNTIILTVLNTIGSGSTVSLSYTDPTSDNDANAIQDPSGNDATGFMQGIVADGYIRGAKIYIDQNGDGIAQESEYTGITTNDDGSFFLPNTLPNGAIIAVGGVNIDTGITQKTPLMAPTGSTTINPLTTLIQATISDAKNTGIALSNAEASNMVASALGINLAPGQTLLNFDPLASNSTIGLAAQKAAAQVATLLALGANGDTDRATQIQNKISGLIRQGTSVDLTDATTLNTLLVDDDHSVNSVSSVISNVVSANVNIQYSNDFTAITAAQSSSLDTVSPFPATILNQPLYTTSTPTVRVQLNNLDSLDGSAPVVGDRVILNVSRLDGEILSNQTTILSSVDLERGYVEIQVSSPLPDGKSIATIAIKDKSDKTSANNDLSEFTSSAIVLVDTGAPEILDVDISTSSANVAHLVAGDTVTIRVTLDEPVSVIGNPTVAINIGGHSTNAQRLVSEGTDYELVFSYTVQTGEAGQLSVGTDCIQLNGGSILGAQNDAADLTLSTSPVVPGGFTFTHANSDALDLNIAEGDTAEIYTVALSTKPTANVTLYLESSSAKDVSLSEDGNSVGIKALTFTPTNWNAPQTFHISATATTVADAGSVQSIYARSQSTDPSYNNLLYGNNGNVFTVTEAADNAAGVLAVQQTNINLGDGDTTNDHLDIHLNYQPTSDVYVTVQSNDGRLMVDGRSTITDTTLIFTPQNWSEAQLVAISAATTAIPGTTSETPSISISYHSDDAGFESAGTLITVTPAPGTTILANNLPAEETPAGWLPTIRQGIEAMVAQFAAIKYPLLGELSATTLKSVVDGVMADISSVVTNTVTTALAFSNLVNQSGNKFLINTGTDEFYIRLQDTVDLVDATLAKDLGFGSAQTSLLSFNLNANASIDLGYDLVLAGGWDGTNGVYFDAATSTSNGVQGSCLLLDLGAQLYGSATGSLGPLNVTVEDKPSTNSEMLGQTTGMEANVDVYLQDGDDNDGKLTLSELGGLFTGNESLEDCFSVDMALNGQISLGVEASLDVGSNAINAFIPDFSFDLNAPFGVSLVHNVTDNNSDAAWFSNLLPTTQTPSSFDVLTKSGNIYLDNMTIGLGDFISQFVAPVVNATDKVVQFLAPLQTLCEYDLADTNNINIQPYEADLSLSSWGIGDFLNPFGKVGKEYLKQLGSDLIANFMNGIIEDLNFDTSNDQPNHIAVTMLEVLTGIVNDAYTKEEATHNEATVLTPEQQTAHTQVLAAHIGVGALNTIIDFMDAFNAAKAAMAASNTSLTNGINLGSVTIPLLNLASTASSEAQVYQPDIVAHEGSGGEVPAFLTEIVSNLENLGFAFPILTDGTSLAKILTLQPVDLMTFTPDIPDIHDLQINVPILNLKDLLVTALPIIAPVKSWIPLTGGLDFVSTINVDSNITAGVDTSGLINWFKGGMGTDLASIATLADGFFISDNISTVNSQTIDLPEISAQIDAGIKALLGVGGSGWGFGASGSAGFGIDGSVALDLVDGGELNGTSDGNVHLGEILQNLNQPTILNSLASALDVNGTLGAYVNAELSAYLHLNDNAVIKGMAEADKWLGWLNNIPILSSLIGAGGFIADLADVVPRVDVTLAATSSTIEIPYTVL